MKGHIFGRIFELCGGAISFDSALGKPTARLMHMRILRVRLHQTIAIQHRVHPFSKRQQHTDIDVACVLLSVVFWTRAVSDLPQFYIVAGCFCDCAYYQRRVHGKPLLRLIIL